MVCNFLGKDENTRRNLYLLMQKTLLWKRSRTFFRTMYPNKTHVTTHPESTLTLDAWDSIPIYSVERFTKGAMSMMPHRIKYYYTSTSVCGLGYL